MLRSLFSGITGLRQHQTLMDVVSNNISNVNTTGFKSSSVVFEDTLSQTIKTAASPTTTSGGLNPAQVGLGVQLGAISTNFGQGSAQNTGTSTDLMIQGDGFFIVKNAGETQYTRSGAFKFDANGTLVTAQGALVQGWMAAPGDGTVNTDSSVGDIKIPAGSLMKPKASDKLAIGGNIPAEAPTATPATITLGQTVFDAAGGAHPLSVVLLQDLSDTTGNTWTVNVYEPAVDAVNPIGTGPLAFDPLTGAYASGSPVAISVATPPTTIELDLTKLTRYGGTKSIAVASASGYSAGSLQQFQISEDGSVIGVFSNEQKLTLGKIALANFNNPPGLEKIGSTSFRSTTNSGLPQVGTAGSGGRGGLLGGTLEMSNVDLAQEFTNLIIAQRGFQANSRVITTSDQMLQDLVDIKR